MAVPSNDLPTLRFPEELPPTPTLSHDDAVRMLLQGMELAKTTPFVWKYVDKPPEGTIILFFVPHTHPPPVDGIQYLELEQRYAVQFNGMELEIHERRLGFVPGVEVIAARLRRRFRLVRGGHPSLFLYHWSRGPPQNVPQQMFAVPVRNYPLRPIGEPPMYVHGERRGQRVQMQPQGAVPTPMPQQGHPQQVQLAAQNQHMAALEARQRQAQAQAAQRAPPQAPMPPRLEEEGDPADDLDHISTRTLAAVRYKRNHEFMNEIFMHAAFGQRAAEKPPSAYAIFDKSQLEERISSLTSDIQNLRTKAAAREAARQDERTNEDVSMSFDVGPAEASLAV